MENRDVSIDMMKGIAIILMIYGHTTFFPIVGNWIYTFHMPLFFFISGCFYTNNYKVTKDFKKLIIPYLIFVSLSFSVDMFLSCTGAIFNNLCVFDVLTDKLNIYSENLYLAISGYEKSFFYKTLWFLPILFIVKLMYYVLQHMLKGLYLNMTMIIFLMISSLLFYMNIDFPYFIDTVLLVIPYYHLGKLFYAKRSEMEICKRYYGIILFIPMIISLLFTYKVDYKYNIVPWYNHIIALMTICGGYFALTHVKKISLFINIGKDSIYYFGLHRTVFLILLPFLAKLRMAPYTTSFLLCIITILFIYLILHFIGEKKKWLLGHI